MIAPRFAILPTIASVCLSLLLGTATRAQILTAEEGARQPEPAVLAHPQEHRLLRAREFRGDLRKLPQTRPEKFERPEREEPDAHPTLAPGSTAPLANQLAPSIPLGPSAPAPTPIASFDGLDFATWGAGHPADTNGDVGPTYYIQTVNTSIGIYNKLTGVRVAAFTFNTLMSQGAFGNLCDTNNFGDPVVLYDTFEDRWIITDFAFSLDGSNNVINPPGSFQCFAASKTGDPVTGGWNFYSINTAGGLGDYPKFGIWPDGLYMSANMFSYPAGGAFQGPRVYALNKAQMYAGAPAVQVVSFNAPVADFTVLPGNARLQAGTPPAGTPNYFVSTWRFTNGLTVYKFHVDWNSISLSTFTGPDTPSSTTSWPNATVPNAPSQGGNSLDALQIRAMMQNQYSNIAGAESLWMAHTVRRGNTSGFAAPRWYQVDVTGGTVGATLPQAATFDPDGANVMHRFIPSVAVDRAGDLALGYTTSSSTTKPAIKYAGRLATDPINTFSQTEQVLIQGAGTQTGLCGGSTCARWGDYSAMTLDPDGCTFWFTSEYYDVDGLNDLTRIGSFSFPGCTPVGSGTLQGTVTAAAGGAAIAGATVSLGSRTALTDVTGAYSFSGLPSGTYPSLRVSSPGFVTGTATGIVVPDAGTASQDFSLSAAPASACLTDTTQADFQTGLASSVDLTTSPGDVVLSAPTLDQQNTTVSTSGVAITITNWGGQTFTPARSGPLVRADVNLFCSGCTGTSPNLTVSVRATTGNPALPTGADLATATIAGFSNSAAVYYSATFATPAMITAGTTYALVIRPTANPAPGTYALIRSSTDVYPGGTRLTNTASGTVWTAQLTTDAGFHTWIDNGFTPSGSFISSTKDANPAPGAAVTWTTLSSTVNLPANTTLRFQVAASSNPNGPFNFVGPDSTAGSFFTGSGSLSQFNGKRYLKYQAFLTSSNSTVTPALNDVTLCFSTPTTVTASPASGVYGGTANLSATLLSGGTGVAGRMVSFTLNGAGAGSGITDAAGVAMVSNVTLAGINAADYPTGVSASFAGDDLYDASSGSSTLSVAKADQAILFGTLADKIATDPSFTVSATGGASTNAVTFSTGSSACSVSVTTVTLLGAGTCAIHADQAGSGNYNAAPQVTQSFTITLASQLISFPAIAVFSWSGGFATLGATSDSLLPVSYTVTMGNCAVAGNTLTATTAGSCIVAADQPGNAFYDAAPQATATVDVSKAPQNIVFSALGDKLATDASFLLNASGGGSGNPVTFSTISPACSVSSSTVTILGAGSCAIHADQAGDANYLVATQVTQSFTITLTPQTISFDTITGFSWGGGFATLSATSNSNLTVAFSVKSGPCLISGTNLTTLTATATGTCTIAADQAGDDHYAAAPQLTQDVDISKAAQVIGFVAPTDKLATDAAFAVSATGGGSSNAVTFSTASTACSVTASTVTLHGAGTCAIRADQAGDTEYLAAAPVTRTFSISLTAQTILFPPIAAFSWNGGSATLSASASSSLAVSYSIIAGQCVLNGALLTSPVAGSCVVGADQAGTVKYAAAPQASGTVDVAKSPQTIGFGALAGKSATDAAFTLSAAGGGSTSAVTFSTTSAACSVSGATVTINGAGTCAIHADQAGDANYLAALLVTQSFNIALAAQSITFPAIAGFSWSGGSATLAATAGSGLAVAYSVASGPCLITGSTLTATAAGSCVISANQGGDGRYGPAAQVTATVTLAKAGQTIGFASLVDKLATDAPFTLSATGGGSASAVVFSSTSTACSVSGSTVTLLRYGSCAINADQSGNADYAAAPRATQTFSVALAPQTITFPAVTGLAGGGSVTMAATASSGLTVAYFLISGPCTVREAKISATAKGTCLVAADQVGSEKFARAPTVQSSVAVAGAVSAQGCGTTPGSPGGAFEVAGLVLAGMLVRRRRRSAEG